MTNHIHASTHWLSRMTGALLVAGVTLLTAPILTSLHAQPITSAAGAATEDAEYLRVVHEYTLKKDGTILYSYAQRLRLLTSFGFTRQFGESFIVYDPALQTLKIDSARTTMASGADVNAPFNAFNEVLPGFAHFAAPWSGMREMVVTHTGLERGAVVRFGYTLTTKPGMYPGMSGRVLLGDRCPVDEVVVRLRVPKGASLRTALAGAAGVAPMVAEEGDMRVETWTLRNIPALAVEANQPPMDQVLPVLFFTTATMRDIATHAVGAAGVFDLPADAVNTVAAVTTGLTTDADKIRALQKYVATNVGGMSADLQYLGFKARPAAETFRDNVGSTIDRAVLLSALLAKAGIPSRVVLHSPYLTASTTGWTVGLPTLDLPCPHLYTSAAVEIHDASGNWLLDPTDAQQGRIAPRLTRGAYLPLTGTVGAAALSVASDEAVRKAETVCDWTLGAEGGLTGRAQVLNIGPSAPDLDPQVMVGRNRPLLLPAAAGITVKKEKVESPLAGRASCEVSIVRLKSPDASGIATVPVPMSAGALSELNLLLPRIDRRTPVLVGKQQESLRMTVHLPSSLRAELPRETVMKNAVGEMRSRMTFNGAAIEVERSISITVPVVPVAQYEDLRALVDAWRSTAQKGIVLHTR